MKGQMKLGETLNGGKTYISKVSVSLVREGLSTERTIISSPEDVYNLCFLRKEFDLADREKFIVLHLSTKNEVISYEVVSIGTLNASLVHPREVFKGAILSNSASIILCHNHPSGDIEPSTEDIVLTERLAEAGKLLGIEVLDHIIFSAGNFRSLKERDIL